ncbi:MAG: helix-turn-helix domain-containing protein [Moraxellaceae bacterium]|nr:helix-turn-helix domain-containing protein [Moraxellaceae bacterium]
MARTKREQAPEEKRNEIVAAARALLVQEGYDATSISRLAAAAGVAPNTIYWYFKDKDEVLIAVLDAELTASMSDYLQLQTTSRTERLLWVANQLAQVSRLVSTVHTRLEQSPAIHAWHERFHELSEGVLRAEFQQAGVAADRIEARVKISVFAIEGLLSHPLPEAEKRAICAALVGE